MKVRVVNIMDLMALYPSLLHPHGTDKTTFVEHLTEDKPIVFAFHGYARAIHEIMHGRPDAPRFHVRGFNYHDTISIWLSSMAGV